MTTAIWILSILLAGSLWWVLEARRLLKQVLKTEDDEMRGVGVHLPFKLESEIRDFLKHTSL